ncbi:MAG: tetratricopeptide repeat protein [Eubacteriales bacterium]|nr:tetratricopeptide repeat protein [Eubacteriales bacterium]
MRKRGWCAWLLGAFLTAALAAGCGSGEEAGNLERGMELIEQMDYENALTSFEAAALNKEDMRQVYRGQGLAYMGMTDYENAAASLEKALALSGTAPDNLDYDINYYLATAYYRGGDTEKAIAVYRAITDLKPAEKTAWYLMGTLELEQGSTEEAQAAFDSAVAAAPNDYDLRIDIFCSCSRNGADELGTPYLQAVLDDDSRKLSDFDKGRISFYLGSYEDARSSLEKALETGGAEAASLLGQTYEALGDYNYAASVYSTYLSDKQPDAALYNQLGLCKLKGGDYQAALEAFQAGLSMENSMSAQQLRFNEIVAYEYLGQYAQAKLAMEQYLSLYPDDEKAQRENVFLQTR